MSKRKYTRQFKAQAVEMVENGSTVREDARALEIADHLIYRWRSEARTEAALRGSESNVASSDVAEADELRRLRREVAQLRSENNILKKAAVILANEPHPRAGE